MLQYSGVDSLIHVYFIDFGWYINFFLHCLTGFRYENFTVYRDFNGGSR